MNIDAAANDSEILRDEIFMKLVLLIAGRDILLIDYVPLFYLLAQSQLCGIDWLILWGSNLTALSDDRL
jgi:hypothetical protein